MGRVVQFPKVADVTAALDHPSAPARLSSFHLGHPARPTPMNAYRKLTWHQRAEHDQAWRQTFTVLARHHKVPALGSITVVVQQVCRPGVTMPDPGACFPTAKAAIDGLVDAGVIPDDTGAHLTSVTFLAPTRGPLDVFALIIDPNGGPG